ncbi:MAG: TorF family putative porin [Mariprofundaceae bacterium]
MFRLVLSIFLFAISVVVIGPQQAMAGEEMKGSTSSYMVPFNRLSLPVYAGQEEGFSIHGNVGIPSAYIWRGIDLTAEPAFVYGDIILGYKGFYGSTWVISQSDRGGIPPRFQVAVEVDWSVGYANNFKNMYFDLGGTWHTFLHDNKANFAEVYAGLSYDWVVTPFVKGYYAVNDNLNLTPALQLPGVLPGIPGGLRQILKGDLWVEAGLRTKVIGFDLLAAVAFASYDSDPVLRPLTVPPIAFFEDGLNLITLGISRDIQIDETTMTLYVIGTIPTAASDLLGNKHIYGGPAAEDLVIGMNIAF